MTADFFVRLTLATHKVAGMLPAQDPLRGQLQGAASKLLASLVLLADENPVTAEQKRQAAPKAIRDLGTIVAYLNYAKRTSDLNPGNFLVLEKEYAKIGEFLRSFHKDTAPYGPVRVQRKEQVPETPVRRPRETATSKKEELSLRQAKILELMRNKDKTQVWELQKVLPQVTKRTLRRDMDDLLKRNLVIRQGEWNEVFYQLR